MNKRIERLVKELDSEEAELLAQLREVREARLKLKSSSESIPKEKPVNGKTTWPELVRRALTNLGKGTANQVTQYLVDEKAVDSFADTIATIRYTLSNNDSFMITDEKEGRSSYYKLNSKKAA